MKIEREEDSDWVKLNDQGEEKGTSETWWETQGNAGLQAAVKERFKKKGVVNRVSCWWEVQ